MTEDQEMRLACVQAVIAWTGGSLHSIETGTLILAAMPLYQWVRGWPHDQHSVAEACDRGR